MIKLLKCEFMKTRRRYVFVTALIVTAAMLAWIYPRHQSADLLRLGWMANLYELPLINSIFMPLLSIIVSSRLCDIEHKGTMLKQLAVTEKRGRIYDAKLLYGLAIMMFCVVLSWGATISFGYIAGFEGDVPIKLYLLYLLFTAVPTIAVYIFQHTLSLCFKNQAVTFFSGAIGTFFGTFSMFLPQLLWLRRTLIWGYYAVLMFVGLFDWTKEDRYKFAHFDVMEIDWTFFIVLIFICAAMYIIGREIFKRKEL